MYFNFACPNCEKSIRVREEHSGRTARCPYCKLQLVIPEYTPAEPPALPTPTAVADAGDVAADAAGANPQIPVIVTSSAGAAATSRSVGPSTRRGSKKRASHDDGTNVSMVWTALIGLGITGVFYLLVGLLPKMYFRDLFYERGLVTVFETYFMSWSLAILALKSRKLMRQRETMLFDLLPESIGKEITQDRVGQFLKHVHDLPVTTASFLVRRVLRGLEHYSVRGSAAEVSTILSSQSELDNAAVSSSYTLLNVFIWAIPIMGFIGTVQGLGNAVGSLSGSLESAADVESIKTSLGAITGGLGVAFDTTLVALIMSVFLKFPASSLQKAEDDLLNWVEEYCNETLIKRLQDVASEQPVPEGEAALAKAINAALVPHHAEFRAWTARLREIGKALTEEFADGWSAVQADLNSRETERQARMDETIAAIDQLVRQQAEAVEQLTALMPRQAQQLGQTATALETLVKSAGETQQEVVAAAQQTAQALESRFAVLQQAVGNLNEVLGSLNGKQVVVQVQSPPRRGWFGR